MGGGGAGFLGPQKGSFPNMIKYIFVFKEGLNYGSWFRLKNAVLTDAAEYSKRPGWPRIDVSGVRTRNGKNRTLVRREIDKE
jgi:hypothetical protein